jgi:hypothetical protein
MMNQDEDTQHKVLSRLDTFLTRDDDRVLFGLHVVLAQPAPEAAPLAQASQQEAALQN